MDLILFSTVPKPITAETFAEWPEHMRREFALLTAEQGVKDATVRERTGITPEALERARQSKSLFALSYAEFRVLDDEEERNAATKRRWKAKVRDA